MQCKCRKHMLNGKCKCAFNISIILPAYCNQMSCEWNDDIKQHLQKTDEFADDDSGLPRDGDLPDDVCEDADEANAEVGGRQMLDEKVHPRLPALGHDEGYQNSWVAWNKTRCSIVWSFGCRWNTTNLLSSIGLGSFKSIFFFFHIFTNFSFEIMNQNG